MLNIFSVQNCLYCVLLLQMKASEGAIEGCLFSEPIEMSDVFSRDMSSVCSNPDRLHVFKVMSPQTGTGEHGVLMLKACSVVS